MAGVKTLLRAIITLLPWPFKRHCLQFFFGYQLHRNARIAPLSWIYPRKLIMDEFSLIAGLTFCGSSVDELRMAPHGVLGRGNWIYAIPRDTPDRFLAHRPETRANLRIGMHAAITSRHLLDCSAGIEVGEFSIVAGHRSQLITHGPDFELARQDARPITIGRYSFVGTGCILMGGASLPDFSILTAGSLLSSALPSTHRLYGGVPAKTLQTLEADLAYFTRRIGYLDGIGSG
jgi:acetyltransferase-like isoleucine patch superfamily enzyme